MHIIELKCIGGLPAGRYKLMGRFERGSDAGIATSVYLNSAVLSATGYRSEKIFLQGSDGFMAYYGGNKMLYMSEDEGLTVRGSTDMPGVLATGTVTQSGSVENVWGKMIKSSAVMERQSQGVYRIKHLVGHSNYTVTVNCAEEGCVATIPQTRFPEYVDIVITKDGVRRDCGFEFVIYGRNWR